jgi:hypothetical protein
MDAKAAGRVKPASAGSAGAGSASARSAPPSLGSTLLRLGRVSNLPTVWSNCVAAAALASAEPDWKLGLFAALSLSVVYTGGMFLNDAFDHRIDTTLGAKRPIATGAIGAPAVYALGSLQLGLALLVVAFAPIACGVGFDREAFISAIGLCALVTVYNAWHKGNPASPLLMAGCRALVYVTVGFMVSRTAPRPLLGLGASVLMLYVVGLTWLAKLEARGLRLHQLGGFATFIAGISLVDAALLASIGRFDWALGAALGFPATLALQRWVRGT